MGSVRSTGKDPENCGNASEEIIRKIALNLRGTLKVPSDLCPLFYSIELKPSSGAL